MLQEGNRVKASAKLLLVLAVSLSFAALGGEARAQVTQLSSCGLTLNSGSYQLSKNVKNTVNTFCFKLAQPAVTLDLNGFQITGTGADSGIVAGVPNVAGFRIKNGSITNTINAINLPGQADVKVDNVDVHDNSGLGLSAGDGAVVTNNRFNNNALGGVILGKNAKVSGNVAKGNTRAGIQTDTGSTLSGNTVSGTINTSIFGQGPLTGDGILAGDGSNISGNTSNGNHLGIECSSGCGLYQNVTNGNASVGILAGVHSTVSGNTTNGNDTGIDAFNAIVTGNGASANQCYGIVVQIFNQEGALVANNQATGNNLVGNCAGFSIGCTAFLLQNFASGNNGSDIITSPSGCTRLNNVPAP